MAILRGFLYGAVVPWCSLMWYHWINLSQRTPIYVGSIITYYLQYMHGAEPLAHHTLCSAEYLTKDKMRRLKAIWISRRGQVVWCYRESREIGEGLEDIEEETQEEEESAQQLRRCTRAQSRAHRDAQQRAHQAPGSFGTVERGESSSAPSGGQGSAPISSVARDPYAHAHQDAHTQGQQYTDPFSTSPEMNKWVFNLTRIMEFMAPPSSNITRSPPHPWHIGQPIPAGYHIWNDEDPADAPAAGGDDDDDDDGDGGEDSIPWYSTSGDQE